MRLSLLNLPDGVKSYLSRHLDNFKERHAYEISKLCHLQKLKDYFEGNAMKSLVSTIEREIKDLVAQATNPEERHV